MEWPLYIYTNFNIIHFYYFFSIDVIITVVKSAEREATAEGCMRAGLECSNSSLLLRGHTTGQRNPRRPLAHRHGHSTSDSLLVGCQFVKHVPLVPGVSLCS